MWLQKQLTLEEFLRKDSEHEICNLRDAYQEFLEKCSDTACGVIEVAKEEPEDAYMDEGSAIKNALKQGAEVPPRPCAVPLRG